METTGSPRTPAQNRGTPTSPATPLPQVFNLCAYAGAAIGYLYVVLAAEHLTVLWFVVFTLINLAWAAAFWYLTEGPCPIWQANLVVTLLIILALMAQAMALLGLEFDWLIPVVTAAILFLGWSIRQALAGTAVIFALAVLTLVLMNAQGGKQGVALFHSVLPSALSILSAYIFVAVFSVVLQHQQDLRARAEVLTTEVSAAKAELEEANTQLRRFSQQVEELTITRERNRMAREIHDTLGHYLTILAVKLETATRLEERADPRLRAELIEARRVASECLAEVRHSVMALRPADPTAASFAEALRQLVREFEAAAPDVGVTFDLEGDTHDLPPELRLTLYRCAQEALTNVRKHARATNVLVRVRVDASTVELTVLDNGMGASDAVAWPTPGAVASAAGGFGLVGMRERIALLNGTITAGAEPEHGWRVEVRVPRGSARPAETPRGPDAEREAETEREGEQGEHPPETPATARTVGGEP